MPKLYCQSCGSATDYSAVKPAFCSACGESFVKKAAAAAAPFRTTPPAPPRSNTTMSHVKTLAERIVEMEAAQDDIPLTFDMTVEAELIDIAAPSNDPNMMTTVQRKLEKRFR